MEATGPTTPFTPPPPPAAPLPPAGDYLRQVFQLGVRSIKPALPALVLLYFYRFGMELYLTVQRSTNTPLGFPDYQSKIVLIVLMVAAYLPILVLVWTPFLPLQDGLLRGIKRSFIESARQVLELVWPYGLSSALQGLIIGGPPCVLLVIVALAMAPLGSAMPDGVRAGVVLLALAPCFIWILLSVFFLAFATPLLVLDGRGPVASIRESVDLIRKHFGGLLGRVILFVLLMTMAALFASLPSGMLTMVSAVAKGRLVGVDVAKAFWDSLVGTALYPFSIAALVVLYRALVPAVSTPEAGLTAPPDASPRLDDATTTATPPYQFE